MRKIHANPEYAIKRKEEQILKEGIKEVEKIKEEIPVPTPMSVPLAKAPTPVKSPWVGALETEEAKEEGAPAPKAPVVTVEDPNVTENKVVEVEKPETRADVDERSVIKRAIDRAEEKLTFKDW